MSEGASDGREPRLARRSPFVPVTKLCPRCLSPLREETKALAGLVPMEYYCEKCGYSGSVYLEKDSEKETEKG